MSEFRVELDWTLGSGELTYGKYLPDHTVRFSDTASLVMTTAPAYGGNVELVNPEQALTAALASCHMLTFLALAAKAKWKVVAYSDRPHTVLGKTPDGRIKIGAITLKPRVTFSGGPAPSVEHLREMHEKAHKFCFVANTLDCVMAVDPIEVAEIALNP
ncbi:MAG: OsmC family protein [Hyphomicrobiales bacterium]